MRLKVQARPFLVISLLLGLPLFLLFEASLNAQQNASEAVPYGRIQELLARNCYRCHGPDTQEGRLRLDVRQRALLGGRSERPAVVPGDSDASRLIERVSHPDVNERMPPEGDALTVAQIDLLRRWINQGADWPDSAKVVTHWAYMKPVRSSPPDVIRTDWPRNPIDRFVLARLEAKGLTPSPQADDTALLRRLSQDLTGLPPTPEELESFLKDANPGRYERLVDRLLASPHYGERMAVPWLDWARYADSNGYQIDRFRPMWMYRDWVIEAFNTNQPFDQFTVEQIAGDLLPQPSLQQQIATGFHRNSMFNDEEGADAEEARFNATSDRVDTTMTVWTATTMGCARCHNHRYDPFSQKEYFQLFAFFNRAADQGAGTPDDIGPVLRFPTAEQQARIDQLEAEEQKLQEQINALDEDDSQEGVRLGAALNAAQQKRWRLLDQVPSALIMADSSEPRPTHVMRRGNFRRPGEAVTSGVPAVLHSMPDGAPRNRLGLARWLVSPGNPLTGRVIANRLWALLFGSGLVSTLDDFGTQGARPTHPELLDWLAVEFVESGWDVKAVLKRIVMSSTYRQSSRVSPQLLETDPENRLLARGPRHRLSAEQIRDASLVASGLLNRKIGGQSVFPPQPEGVWSDVTVKGLSLDNYVESEGVDRHRRGLYTFWRRSALYPTFALFDAPDRKLCTVARQRTTTPLQALATLNDEAFVEASIGLGRRMLAHEGDRRQRLTYGFRLAVTRSPKDEELKPLEDLLKRQLAAFRQRSGELASLTEQARKMGLQEIGDPAELGAWSVAASVLLNLDEALTKQ